MEDIHSPQPHPTRRAARELECERFRLCRVQALTALLDNRRELRGVSALADHLHEAVRWSA